ncbi:MAG: hypothetical protein H6868_04815 [Rhodospirillales bacterium]|nr:hypothetical protein [Rhodospirillales bacterium]
MPKFKSPKGIIYRIENDPQKREEAIKNDIPVRFEIERDIEQAKKLNVLDDIYNMDFLGRHAVQKHDGTISKYAQKHNIDPDIVRSVMFAENARGHKLGGNYAGDVTRKSESPLPMNIQKHRWSSLVDKQPDDLYDPDTNIEAATILLRRITDRIEKPTAEKVGSVWHHVGRQKTDQFGEYIGKVYKEKPWRKID